MFSNFSLTSLFVTLIFNNVKYRLNNICAIFMKPKPFSSNLYIKIKNNINHVCFLILRKIFQKEKDNKLKKKIKN